MPVARAGVKVFVRGRGVLLCICGHVTARHLDGDGVYGECREKSCPCKQIEAKGGTVYSADYAMEIINKVQLQSMVGHYQKAIETARTEAQRQAAEVLLEKAKQRLAEAEEAARVRYIPQDMGGSP